MKIRLFIALASWAVVTPAFSQGSVTLYGVLDEGLNYTNNVGGHSQVALASGFPHGSRWGLKGAEAIGGGIKTIFQLENGFDVDSGRAFQGGLLFGRQAYVGVSSDTLGALTAGRQYDAVVDFLAQNTAGGTWGGYMFAHPYDSDNLINTFRTNNAVKYTSPALGGLKFGATYGFSNDVKASNNRLFSVGGQYTVGGWLLSAAYLQADHPSATSYGAINNGGDQNLLGSRLRIVGAGATYTLGKATLGLAYSNTDVGDPQSSGYVGPIVPPVGRLSSLRFQSFEVNVKYPFGASYWVGAMYTYTRASFNATSGRPHPTYHSIGLMADHLLSKRTDVYLQGVYQHAGGDTTGTVLDAAYVPGAAGVSSNRNQVLLRAGVRHFF
ncbi:MULTISPECIES: porin [Ralstonia solanacearum species complex]|uniref:Putative porin signal peptide protein n=1 Tax=Ralstonia solanacearum TaxID=305 RepID=A0A0S4V364_RALSL|nr:porin [Ralstonia pseudosolanacearum]QIK18112.1 porin [Ralstonia solanacearum]MCK4120884.1 porin [Ralstonia pseudosolanacearum]MDO3520482.1 porin [Ralstonia pseudosolanacearum]MDO3545259.1 porin [Ralstonia pseudosolanacearum]MDO3551385.1 porin [Ralstonia pseudosolanacearum]